jgi:hypothetical protein
MTLRTLLCEVRGGNLLPVARGGTATPIGLQAEAKKARGNVFQIFRDSSKTVLLDKR